MAYYRLVGGKIVVNDVMSVPDHFQVLVALMAPASGAQSYKLTSARQTRTQVSDTRVEVRVPSPDPP